MVRNTITARAWTWALALAFALVPAGIASAVEIDHSSPEKVLETFFAAINEGDHEAALTALHPGEREDAQMDDAPEELTYTIKKSRTEEDWALTLVEMSYDGETQTWPIPTQRIDGNWYVLINLFRAADEMPDWIEEQAKAWEAEEFLNDPDVVELKLDTPIEVTLGDSSNQFKLVLPSEGILRIEGAYDTSSGEGVWMSLSGIENDFSASSDDTETGVVLESDVGAGTYRLSVGTWGEEFTVTLTATLYTDGNMPEGSVAWDVAKPLALELAAGETCTVYVTLSASELYLFARQSEDTPDGYYNISLWHQGEHVTYGSDFLLATDLAAGRYRLMVHSQGETGVNLELSATTPDQVKFHDVTIGTVSDAIKVSAAAPQFAHFTIEEPGLYSINAQYEYGEHWLQMAVYQGSEQVSWSNEALEELNAGRHVVLLRMDQGEVDVRLDVRRVGALTEGQHTAALQAGLPMAYRLTLEEEKSLTVAAALDAEAALDLAISEYEGSTLVSDSSNEGKVTLSITLPAGEYMVQVGISDWSDVPTANLTLDVALAAPAPLAVPDGANVVEFGADASELTVTGEGTTVYFTLAEARLVEIELMAGTEEYVSVKLQRRDFPINERGTDEGLARLVTVLEAGVYNLVLSTWSEETACKLRVGPPPQLKAGGEVTVDLPRYSNRQIELTVTEAGTYTIAIEVDSTEGVDLQIVTLEEAWVGYSERTETGAVAEVELEPGTYIVQVYSSSETAAKGTISVTKN